MVAVETWASQTVFEFKWVLAARFGKELARGRLTHGGRDVDAQTTLAESRIVRGALLVASFHRQGECSASGPGAPAEGQIGKQPSLGNGGGGHRVGISAGEGQDGAASGGASEQSQSAAQRLPSRGGVGKRAGCMLTKLAR